MTLLSSGTLSSCCFVLTFSGLDRKAVISAETEEFTGFVVDYLKHLLLKVWLPWQPCNRPKGLLTLIRVNLDEVGDWKELGSFIYSLDVGETRVNQTDKGLARITDYGNSLVSSG